MHAALSPHTVTVCMNANGVFIFDTKLGGQLMAVQVRNAPSLRA